jgi:hypothetical protein
MTSKIDWFTKYVTLPNNKPIFLGDDTIKQLIDKCVITIWTTTSQIM